VHEGQPAALGLHPDRVARLELAGENPLSERVLELLLDLVALFLERGRLIAEANLNGLRALEGGRIELTFDQDGATGAEERFAIERSPPWVCVTMSISPKITT